VRKEVVKRVNERCRRLHAWARRLGAAAGDQVDPSSSPPPSAWGVESGRATDRRLWEVVAATPAPSARVIEAVSGLRLAGPGPLLERAGNDAVEVWVDRELAAMHALHRACRVLRRAEWGTRLHAAVAWHVEHTGTENATHRPWAVHVFLLCGSSDAEFFAAGQLHAVAVEHAAGPPDPCTAWILQDAARELDLAADAADARLP